MREDWIEFGEVTVNFDGQRKPLSRIYRENFKGIYPYYGACEIIDYVKDFLFDGDYILIGEDGANLLSRSKPLSFIASGKFWVNNHAHVVKPISSINLKFINLQFNSIQINDFVTGTAQPKLNQNNLNKIPIIIAPLPEQRAIVAKIEQLFSELDNGIASFKTAQTQLEIYRQSVLKKAFEGESTTFLIKELGSIGKWSGGGTPSKNNIDFWENGNILWVSPKDMKTKIINDTIDKITENSIKKSSAKWIDKHSILIVVRSGIIRRTLPIAIAGRRLTVNQDMQCITPDTNLISEFLYWYLISEEKNIRQKCAKTGTTVDNINVSLLKKYPVPFFSIEEQKQIVQEIESRLSVCDKLAETIKAELDKAEALRQT
ncbi:MAG: hypothetical protein BWK73_41690 [Thiothrix lacustris]|uniref:Type I restriction modification DNA specificity domain-containing protein n=1 Tax=Thiothrix lacustris TaxID=525917 RepID=A0A1Y1QD29_9GAMM|nr:MAG: hypothetical protein BWK73_41690 [Thiothrix lacustris]